MASVRPVIKVRTVARDVVWKSLPDKSKVVFKAQAVRLHSGVSLAAMIAEFKTQAPRDDSSGDLKVSDELKIQARILDLYLIACYQDLFAEISSLLEKSSHLGSSISEEMDLLRKNINAARQVRQDIDLRDVEAVFPEFAEEFASLKHEIERACINYAKIEEKTKDRFRDLRIIKQQFVEMKDAKTSPKENADLFLAELAKLNQKQSDVEQEIKNITDDAVNFLMRAISEVKVARAQLKELTNENKLIEKSSSELTVLEKQIKQNMARCREVYENERQELDKRLKQYRTSIINLAETVEEKSEPQDSTPQAEFDSFARMIQPTEKDMAAYERRKDFLAKKLSELKSEHDDEWYEKQISGEQLNSINKKKDSYKGVGHKPAKLGPSQALKDAASIFAIAASAFLGVVAAISNPIGWGIFAGFMLVGSYFLVRNYARAIETTRHLQAHEAGLAGLLQEENEKEKNKEGSTCSRDLRMLIMREAVVRCESLTGRHYHNLELHGEYTVPEAYIEPGEVPCVVNQKEGDRDFSKSPLFYREKKHALFFKVKQSNGSYAEVPLANDHEGCLEQFRKFSPLTSPAA